MHRLLKILGLSFSLLALSACGTSAATNPFLSQNPTRVPTISMQNPLNLNEPVDDTYTINVGFGSVVLGDTWTLYYMSEASATRGSAIVENVAVSNHTIAWRTTEIPSGTYFFYGELKSFGGIVTATAPGSIVIDHPIAAENHSPTVSLSSPSGGSVDVGSTEKILWNGTDQDGDALTYNLEISADAGNTWTALASGITDESYDWNVSQAPGLSYRVRVTATDASGATAKDTSNNVFSIQ